MLGNVPAATHRTRGRIWSLRRAEQIALTAITTAIAACFLAQVAIERRPLYYGNQHTYFPAGLARAGQEYLQADWFAGTRPPHVAFTYLVEILARLDILGAGVAAIQTLLEVALLAAIWLVLAGIHGQLLAGRPGSERAWLALTTVSFSLIVLGMQYEGAPLDLISDHAGEEVVNLGQTWEHTFRLEGLAHQYIWGRYLQPSEFGILILLAIGVMLFERWRLGALLCGAATIMHAGYLPHAGLLVLVGAAWLYRGGRRRTALETLVIYGICALPVAVYALSFSFDPGRAEALDILANFRVPHHAQPEEWWSTIALGKLGAIGVASLLALRHRASFLSWVLVIGFGYTIAGIVGLWYLIDSDALAMSFPWRVSVYLVPVSLCVIVAVAVTAIARLLRLASERPSVLPWLAAITGMLVLLSTGSRTLEARPRPRGGTRAEIAALVRRHTRATDVILVPEHWEEFRLEARRPIYVDFKSHPYKPSEVIEWRRRIQVSRRFYTGTPKRRDEICAGGEFDYYIISGEALIEPHRAIAEQDGYRLVACPA